MNERLRVANFWVAVCKFHTSHTIFLQCDWYIKQFGGHAVITVPPPTPATPNCLSPLPSYPSCLVLVVVILLLFSPPLIIFRIFYFSGCFSSESIDPILICYTSAKPFLPSSAVFFFRLLQSSPSPASHSVWPVCIKHLAENGGKQLGGWLYWFQAFIIFLGSL